MNDLSFLRIIKINTTYLQRMASNFPQDSQHGYKHVTPVIDHFVRAPQHSGTLQGKSEKITHRRQPGEWRKPNRLVPRNKGTKAGRLEAGLLAREAT